MLLNKIVLVVCIVIFLCPAFSACADDIEDIKAEMKVLKEQLSRLEARLAEKASAPAESSSAYAKSASPLELPDISVIVDMEANFSDNSENETKDKVRVKEAELAFSGYLYPSVRGDFIAALEQEYEGSSVSTEIDVEEAYLSFLELPASLQATVGRRLIPFGKLNSVHPHHWMFTTTPLANAFFFGHHPWLDDGIELSWLAPADLYFKVSAGVWNGKAMGHAHSHSHEGEEEEEEEEHGHFGEELIEWDGHVFTGRALFDVAVTDDLNCSLGTSLAKDEGDRNTLQGLDLVIKYQWPMTYRKLKWHTELFRLDDKERDINPQGFFTMCSLTLDKYWETGLRYDRSEFADSEDYDASAWSAFLTYYFTHTMYLRGEYQNKEHATGLEENLFFLQLVWGIGPHSHRME